MRRELTNRGHISHLSERCSLPSDFPESICSSWYELQITAVFAPCWKNLCLEHTNPSKCGGRAPNERIRPDREKNVAKLSTVWFLFFFCLHMLSRAMEACFFFFSVFAHRDCLLRVSLADRAHLKKLRNFRGSNTNPPSADQWPCDGAVCVCVCVC